MYIILADYGRMHEKDASCLSYRDKRIFGSQNIKRRT